jgi:hypothetical protein
MRKIGGTINVYKFEELKYYAKKWAIGHYYKLGDGENLDSEERRKAAEYFEGVEFFEDGTVYEEV